MSALPPVTIGIPVYNAAPWLGDAVRSILAQTHRDFELLLVDDGSSDDSLAVARSIRDPRVRVIADGVNRGLAARLNQVATEARHDFVARMDADDLCHPERLERQLRFLEARLDIDLVGTGTYSVDSERRLLGARGHVIERPSLGAVLAGAHGLVHASLVYRKAWIVRNPYDPAVRRSEDYALWARTAAAGDLASATLPDPLYVYREDLNVTRAKLLAAYGIERATIRSHATGGERARHLLRNAAKTALVTVAFPVLRRSLLERRNPDPVSTAAREEYERILARIDATPVTGLETRR